MENLTLTTEEWISYFRELIAVQNDKIAKLIQTVNEQNVLIAEMVASVQEARKIIEKMKDD